MIICRHSLRNLKSLSQSSISFQSFHFCHSSSVLVDSEAYDGNFNLSHSHAHDPFDKIQQRDISYYNHFLFEYSRNGFNEEALRTYAFINRTGVLVDGCSLSSILKVSASLNDHAFGRQIHCQSVRNGFFGDVSVGTSLVDMYVKNENLDDGKRVFDEIKVKNVVTWTSLLTGYAKKGMTDKVIKAFSLMKFEGIEPNPFTFSTVIGALADEVALEIGAQLHSMTIKNGLDSTRVVGNALVSLYSKCGMSREARYVFDGTECRDVVSWNGMIAVLIMNARDLDALELFNRMRLTGVKFTQTTFATVVKLCANLKELGLARQMHCRAVEWVWLF